MKSNVCVAFGHLYHQLIEIETIHGTTGIHKRKFRKPSVAEPPRIIISKPKNGQVRLLNLFAFFLLFLILFFCIFF